MLSSVPGSEVSRNIIAISLWHPYEVGPAMAGLKAHLIGEPTKLQMSEHCSDCRLGWGSATAHTA